MKAILKHETIERTKYICDFCGKEFDTIFWAEQCEIEHKQEKCLHSEVQYRIQFDIVNFDGMSDHARLVKYCPKCNRVLTSLEITSDELAEKFNI